MRSRFVVLFATAQNDFPGLGHTAEPVLVEALIPKTPSSQGQNLT
jgi:hypothetical protein